MKEDDDWSIDRRDEDDGSGEEGGERETMDGWTEALKKVAEGDAWRTDPVRVRVRVRVESIILGRAQCWRPLT
jgi:hypothetical protein